MSRSKTLKIYRNTFASKDNPIRFVLGMNKGRIFSMTGMPTVFGGNNDSLVEVFKIQLPPLDELDALYENSKSTDTQLEEE
jgi:hypothetical protein